MASLRMERLSTYLAASARRPIDYASGWDCAAGFVARWVEQERGVDGAAMWRGLYRTEAGCMALLGREGGLLAMVRRGAEAVGLSETSEASPGDVGVVRVVTPDGYGPVAAIRTGIGWATLTARGLLVAPHPVISAWRI